MSPLVSIIIPCYNKRAYVSAAIDSALAQGTSAEVLVIDDGSTDGSLEEIRNYEGRIVWETGPNRGGSAARNRGLERARGRYIKFLDADDILPPGHVAAQLAALQAMGERDVAFCPWSFFHDDGRIDAANPRRYWHGYPAGLDLLIDMWTWGGFFPPHTWLVSRALIDLAGPWDEQLSGDDDGEFFGRLLIHAERAHFVSDTHVLYRDPPQGSVSRNRSLESVRSFYKAYVLVSEAILAKRGDVQARRACLSRLRDVAYQLRQFDEIIDLAAREERNLGLRDFSPRLPTRIRIAIGLLGLKKGLAIRRVFESGFRRKTSRSS